MSELQVQESLTSTSCPFPSHWSGPSSRPFLALELSVNLPSRLMNSSDQGSEALSQKTLRGQERRDRDSGRRDLFQVEPAKRDCLGGPLPPGHPCTPRQPLCPKCAHLLQVNSWHLLGWEFLRDCPSDTVPLLLPRNSPSGVAWTFENTGSSWPSSCPCAWRADSHPHGRPPLRRKEHFQRFCRDWEGWWLRAWRVCGWRNSLSVGPALWASGGLAGPRRQGADQLAQPGRAARLRGPHCNDVS